MPKPIRSEFGVGLPKFLGSRSAGFGGDRYRTNSSKPKSQNYAPNLYIYIYIYIYICIYLNESVRLLTGHPVYTYVDDGSILVFCSTKISINLDTL
jgi:hypothetical protein